MPPSLSQLLEDYLALFRQEVTALLAKVATEKVPVPEVGRDCYSRYFLMPKKDMGLLPILDLWDINYFLKKEKFKMLTLAQVLSALDPGDWMVALDLQDAFFHIPILPVHRRYLRFVVYYQLFVRYVGAIKGKAVQKRTISRWALLCIKMCYALAKKQPPEGLRAHSTRATAASTALALGVPVLDICQAASWASLHTFAKHYCLDSQVRLLRAGYFGCSVLQDFLV
ncbi:hypothetical protein NDU88_002313 [Pleurodeles waltl]|uniref:Reverse transcriptase domain-containing protein n=1 Tax=Pleurodeles waltl TaxID=8319 RepID=A0AAV7T2D7_PLEWA|nr:hypothetical protein NDU88_002313 [Pleurodeles waltl]